MSKLTEDFFKYICQTSPEPLALEIVRAQGPYVYSADGRRYLDLVSGIGVANVGHGRAEILEAIAQQSQLFLHPMVYGEFVIASQVEYARQLADRLPGAIDNVFFTNSGAEAVEGALKTARKYTGRTEILSFEGCYHGDTMGALSCQSSPRYRQPFAPLVPDFYHLPWNDLSGLDRITHDTAAVIIEPVQGEGGIRIPSADFIEALRRGCSATGTLLIFDEVMTGFGRTGKLFAAEHWRVTPDLMVLAKALGGGLPLGAFAGPRPIMQTLATKPPLSHVTTFGGNPLSCAAGLAALGIILREDLPAAAVRIGNRFLDGLRRIADEVTILNEVRGLGCLIGVEFSSEVQTEHFTRRCREAGVIVGWTLHHSNILRMAPPLILTDDEIDAALEVMAAAARQVAFA